MTYYDLEFSFHAHIPQNIAYKAFAKSLNDSDVIVISDDDYLEKMHLFRKGMHKELSRYMGVRLLWDNYGYKTLMNVIYFGDEIHNDRLEEICYCLAKELDTEVAIGDFIHTDYDDVFIVYTPSGERWFAADACEEDCFELVRVEYGDTEEQNGVNDRE